MTSALLAVVLLLAGDTHPAVLFTVGIGPGSPLSGDEQNSFLPCGAGPASFDVDGEGRWWILDAIAAKVVVVGRDGTPIRSLALPTAKGKKREYYADLALDGAGGVFVLNASARRVIHLAADGTSTNFGSEKLPHDKTALLDLPRRISVAGDGLFVEDGGSDALLHFGFDGAWQDAAPAPNGIPGAGGSVMGVIQDGSALWVESAPAKGHLRPLAKLAAADGRELEDAWLVGTIASGETVVAQREDPGGNDGERLRVVRIDAAGKPAGSQELPSPDDGVSPTRRVRLTPAGGLAWFRVEGGRLQAFETRW